MVMMQFQEWFEFQLHEMEVDDSSKFMNNIELRKTSSSDYIIESLQCGSKIHFTTTNHDVIKYRIDNLAIDASYNNTDIVNVFKNAEIATKIDKDLIFLKIYLNIHKEIRIRSIRNKHKHINELVQFMNDNGYKNISTELLITACVYSTNLITGFLKLCTRLMHLDWNIPIKNIDFDFKILWGKYHNKPIIDFYVENFGFLTDLEMIYLKSLRIFYQDVLLNDIGDRLLSIIAKKYGIRAISIAISNQEAPISQHPLFDVNIIPVIWEYLLDIPKSERFDREQTI